MQAIPGNGTPWGTHARDYADLIPVFLRPAYETVFQKVGVGTGTRLLDIACGAGNAAALALALGAQVSGVDAAESLIQVAREQIPAGDFRVADMENLPHPDQSFDAVTSFLGFVNVRDPINALREARRVTRRGGRVGHARWVRGGQVGTFEFEVILHAARNAAQALLPSQPPQRRDERPAADRFPPLGSWPELVGPTPIDVGEVACPFIFPDTASAWRASRSIGPIVRIVAMVGEETVRKAVLDAFDQFRQPDGSCRLHKLMGYVIAVS